VAKNTMKSGIEIMCMNNYLVMANVVFWKRKSRYDIVFSNILCFRIYTVTRTRFSVSVVRSWTVESRNIFRNSGLHGFWNSSTVSNQKQTRHFGKWMFAASWKKHRLSWRAQTAVLNYWTTEIVQKSSNSRCHVPQSEPSRTIPHTCRGFRVMQSHEELPWRLCRYWPSWRKHAQKNRRHAHTCPDRYGLQKSTSLLEKQHSLCTNGNEPLWYRGHAGFETRPEEPSWILVITFSPFKHILR
jgi:hypothetical protein